MDPGLQFMLAVVVVFTVGRLLHRLRFGRMRTPVADAEAATAADSAAQAPLAARAPRYEPDPDASVAPEIWAIAAFVLAGLSVAVLCGILSMGTLWFLERDEGTAVEIAGGFSLLAGLVAGVLAGAAAYRQHSAWLTEPTDDDPTLDRLGRPISGAVAAPRPEPEAAPDEDEWDEEEWDGVGALRADVNTAPWAYAAQAFGETFGCALFALGLPVVAVFHFVGASDVWAAVTVGAAGLLTVLLATCSAVGARRRHLTWLAEPSDEDPTVDRLGRSLTPDGERYGSRTVHPE